MYTYRSNEGTKPTHDPSVKKTQYYLLLKAASGGLKRVTDRGFKKIVFLKENKEESTSLALIQYIGDESISIPRSHGNSKIPTSVFIPSKPSTNIRIEAQIEKNELKSAHKIYKEEVAKPVESIVDQPRNTRQVRYIRQKVQDDNRISRDAIVNIHALAYEDPTFVHTIVTYPDLIIVCGMKEVFEEFSEVLENFDANRQHLSYDTTFNVGDFYVSPLLFKNPLYKETPVIPLLFLVHERKLTKHHQCLFDVLCQQLTKAKLTNVPITIDMEQGILLAIAQTTPLTIIGCWRHLSGIVKRWVSGHGGKKDDQRVYVDDLYSLLNCKVESEYLVMYDDKKVMWSEAYVDFFDSNIHTKFHYFARYSIQDKIKMTENGITTNISEGFNFLVKDLNDWKERPIDSILLSFRFLQQYYLRELDRGRAGIGNYHLVRPEFVKDITEVSTSQVLNYEDIVSNIQNGTYITPQLPNTEVKSTNVFKAKALELIHSNQVHLIPQNKCFSVISGKNYYTVSLAPPKARCTCPSPKLCSHILAAYLSMGIEPDESLIADTTKIINLTTLRKNARGTKKKSGRKQPRAGDYDLEPAEDSAAKRAKVEEVDDDDAKTIIYDVSFKMIYSSCFKVSSCLKNLSLNYFLNYF